MKTLRLLAFVLLIVFPLSLFVSCGDDDEAGLTRTELLTASAWVFSSLDVPDDPTGVLEITLAPIFAGFTMNFSANGTYTIVFPSDPDPNDDGVWVFSSDETQVILDQGTADETTAQILILTGSNLDFQFTDDEFGILPITLKMTH